MEQIKAEVVVDNLQQVIDFATEQLEARKCSMKISIQSELVIEEIFVNISSCAYHPASGDVTRYLDFVEKTSAVELTFTDGGKPYNLLERPDPDTTLDLDHEMEYTSKTARPRLGGGDIVISDVEQSFFLRNERSARQI